MIKETFKQDVQNVLSNKVRNFLTMLGIIIGVMAVIVIVGLGNGMTNMMQDFYSDMGSDILSVNVMTASTRSVEVDDVYRIINEKPEYYKGLSPIASAGGDTLRVAGEKYRRTGINGVNEHCSRSLYHPDERQQHQQCQPVLCGPAGRGPLG